MNDLSPNRRVAPRFAIGTPINVLIDGQRYDAQLTDLSVSGIQARMAESDVLTTASRLEAIAFPGGATLSVRVVWALFDGTFGASFTDPVRAEIQIQSLLSI